MIATGHYRNFDDLQVVVDQMDRQLKIIEHGFYLIDRKVGLASDCYHFASNGRIQTLQTKSPTKSSGTPLPHKS